MNAYLDNSATTKPYKEVVAEMVLALTKDFENPSSAYRRGLEVELKIKNIRKSIAKTIGAKEKSIIFTSGGTESNNAIIRSVASLNKKRKKHIITSAIEHPAVLNTVKSLESEGFEITALSVDKNGRVDIEQLKSSLNEKTCLVSIMLVNNEIGIVEPIEEIGKIIKEYDKEIFFHVDAVQGYGKLKIDVDKLKVDFLSVSGHKIHGPKGIGFMYIRDENKFNPLITGGGQEFNIRPGTENVPGIFGIGKAVEILFADLDKNIDKMKSVRDYLYNQLKENIDGIHLNTDLSNSVCHILNVSIEAIRGEVLLHYLEGDGICISTGSACSSKKKGSHVLNAIGLSSELIDGAIRFSVSEFTTAEEIDYTVEKIKNYVEIIRLLSKNKKRR
ncbi:cysteine desulfurase family protein [Peptostreptococcus sp. D1]|uniref:cysteine desulfurase family protein n=1 Tax=Peptostreptococcus sp. D1 TaxID=72304 RepID=UPI0008E3CB83|nr:cysteine desulfurase family protein [Peptostreptococcus sp. D1]SFE54867.1 cysteine desulfurase [Peptostreptococcus sp. D1]